MTNGNFRRLVRVPQPVTLGENAGSRPTDQQSIQPARDRKKIAYRANRVGVADRFSDPAVQQHRNRPSLDPLFAFPVPG